MKEFDRSPNYVYDANITITGNPSINKIIRIVPPENKTVPVSHDDCRITDLIDKVLGCSRWEASAPFYKSGFLDKPLETPDSALVDEDGWIVFVL